MYNRIMFYVYTVESGEFCYYGLINLINLNMVNQQYQKFNFMQSMVSILCSYKIKQWGTCIILSSQTVLSILFSKLTLGCVSRFKLVRYSISNYDPCLDYTCLNYTCLIYHLR
jgi:hypothetical protein